MKKLVSLLSVLALMATMTIALDSCTPKNQPEQTNPSDSKTTDEPSIVGEWKFLYYETDDGKIQDYEGYESMIFVENGTFFQVADDYSYKGNYTLSGKTLIISVIIDDDETEVLKLTIKELTKDRLVIYNHDAETFYLQRVN